jgi:hypothetical protein
MTERTAGLNQSTAAASSRERRLTLQKQGAQQDSSPLGTIKWSAGL